MAQFIILGTAAGTGVPSFFCTCAACQEARENPQVCRTRNQAALLTEVGTVLIDASPDLRTQLERASLRQVDQVFLTHWHFDHFGGLGELEFYVRLERGTPLPLYLPPSAVRQFEDAFPHLKDVFAVRVWEFGQRYDFGGVSVTPLAAVHGIETAGLLLQSPGKRVAYFTDTAILPAPTLAALRGVDYFVCDATFNGENWYPESHMSVEEAIALGQRVEAGATVLTHLAMHYSEPVTSAALQGLAARNENVMIAYDGMVIEM